MPPSAASADSDITIAWLRGINVGGHRKIKMADLRTMCEGLGASEVVTYIQSGNLIFRPGGELLLDSSGIEERLTHAIEATFGFEVPVMVRTIEEVAAARASIGQRFAEVLAADEQAEKMVHVLFLSDKPTADAAALDPERSPSDVYVVEGRTLHVHYGDGAAKTKLTPAWLEKSLGVSATARNVRTLDAVLALAKKL